MGGRKAWGKKCGVRIKGYTSIALIHLYSPSSTSYTLHNTPIPHIQHYHPLLHTHTHFASIESGSLVTSVARVVVNSRPPTFRVTHSRPSAPPRPGEPDERVVAGVGVAMVREPTWPGGRIPGLGWAGGWKSSPSDT